MGGSAAAWGSPHRATAVQPLQRPTALPPPITIHSVLVRLSTHSLAHPPAHFPNSSHGRGRIARAASVAPERGRRVFDRHHQSHPDAVDNGRALPAGKSAVLDGQASALSRKAMRLCDLLLFQCLTRQLHSLSPCSLCCSRLSWRRTCLVCKAHSPSIATSPSGIPNSCPESQSVGVLRCCDAPADLRPKSWRPSRFSL